MPVPSFFSAVLEAQTPENQAGDMRWSLEVKSAQSEALPRGDGAPCEGASAPGLRYSHRRQRPASLCILREPEDGISQGPAQGLALSGERQSVKSMNDQVVGKTKTELALHLVPRRLSLSALGPGSVPIGRWEPELCTRRHVCNVAP